MGRSPPSSRDRHFQEWEPGQAEQDLWLWAPRCVSLQSGQDLDSSALFLHWMLDRCAEGVQWPTRSLQFSPASNMNLTELERTIFF